MLEIFWLLFFSKKIGKIVQDKGYKPGGYRALAVLLWFGAEVVGVIIGIMLFEDPIPGYVVGLLCAIASAIIVYLRVKGLPDKMPEGITSVAQQQWQCPQCGVRNTSWDQKCVGCGIPRPAVQIQAT
jgi:hypothetical protein